MDYATWSTAKARAAAATTNVTTNVGAENAAQAGAVKEAQVAGQEAAKRRGDMLTAADTAPDKIARLQLMRDVLSNTQTGPLAGTAGQVGAVAQSLGISPDTIKGLGLDPNQATNNEIAQKLSNELVAGSIGAKNGGFPASNFSVAERQFIEKMFPSIASQPGSNQAVSDVLIAREQRNLQKADEWSPYKQQQRQAGKPLSYEDFEDQWQGAHGKENIFAPIQEKFLRGDYANVGAGAPTPNASGMKGNAMPGAATQPPAGAPAGAKQAQDGHWYVPDPARPGKYLQVQ